MVGIGYQDMVHYHRYNQWRKGEYNDDDKSHAIAIECSSDAKRRKPKRYSLLFLSVLSCSLVLILQLLTSSSSAFSLLYSIRADYEGSVDNMNMNAPMCSSMQNGTMCCDRSSFRSDVCIMKGDLRTNSASSSVFLYAPKRTVAFFDHIYSIFGATQNSENLDLLHEKIKPYTRKWETSIMDTIDELDLVVKKESVGTDHHCDVEHNVPAIFFSTGGYTGNVYHEFNDGIIPLYITSQHLKKKVVFVILEYHNWWISKYKNILSLLSDYPPVDFSGDRRTHCFHEAVVGLKIHEELSVNPSLMMGNKSIVDFRNLLDRAYWPRIRGLIQDEEQEMQQKLMDSVSPPASEISLKSDEEKQLRKPKLVILSRNGSRAILNEESLVKLAEEIGFTVEILRPDRTTELAKVYHVLNSSDVMVGVHGAAMTHFLFMKPGSVFIQVVPIGTDWPAAKYYGEPAVKLGLGYIRYKILPRESSLSKRYDRNDPVLVDPKSVTKKGWQYIKTVYLDSQNVTLDLKRFRSRLARAYAYSLSKMNSQLNIQ